MIVQNLVLRCKNIHLTSDANKKILMIHHIHNVQKFHKITIQKFEDPQCKPFQMILIKQKKHVPIYVTW